MATMEERIEQIERIEELRYEISKSTYDLLKKKKQKEKTSNLEKIISSMRGELEGRIGEVKKEGIDCIILNKKSLGELKEKFMKLGSPEKAAAIEGKGENATIVRTMNNILKDNAENSTNIAKISIALSNLIGEKEKKNKVKGVLEGYSESTTTELGGPKDIMNNFTSAAQNLGFSCEIAGNKFSIKKTSEGDKEKEARGKEEKEKVKKPKAIEKQITKPATKQTQPEAPKVPKYSLKEINKKIDYILSNKKMQRWVLNTFKDDDEREEYKKAQIVLAELMKRKRILESKG